MTDETSDAEPPNLSLRRAEQQDAEAIPPPSRLLAIVRFLADHTEKVIFSDHAQERMWSRGFTSEDVYSALRCGEICGRITRGRAKGEFKCKIVAKPRGSRSMGVATVVVMDGYLFIKTVEWEDR